MASDARDRAAACTEASGMLPYLDTLRWVFIAVALIGIVVAIHARIADWKRGQR